MIRHTSWARAVFSVLLALCLCSVLQPIRAYADQGSIIVSQEVNADAVYDAYLVFSAQVNEEGQASNLAWPSEGVRQVVLRYLDAQGYETWLEEVHPGEDQHDFAQNAAEYIGIMIASSEMIDDGEATELIPVGSSFATGLAQALATSELEPTTSVEAGQQLEGEQGYWLLVTNQASLSSPDDAGTAPLWLIVGPAPAETVEKASVPIASFAVQEDSTQTWQKVADSNRGQDLPYRVEGTLPTNFDAFSSYHYRFEMRIPEQLELPLAKDNDLSKLVTLTVDGEAAEIDGTEVQASFDGSVLCVDIPNLRDEYWLAQGVDSTSTIVVEYRAHLNGKASVGMPGATTEAVLVYTADPVALTESTTTSMAVTVFTYQLELLKADSQSGTLIPGASFSLRANETDGNAEKLYVQEDGSLGTLIHTFTTDDHGKVAIAGLDEGSYTLEEVAAPNGYQKLEGGITLTIATHLSDLDRTIEDFTLSTSENAPCKARDIQPEKGSASLQIDNTKLPVTTKTTSTNGTNTATNRRSVERLPQTGVGPIAELFIVIGLSIAGISIVRSRRTH